MAEGIDVFPKYQQITDFTALARTRQFVYVKASDGMTLRDTAGYGPLGRAAGLKMGGYHYAQPGDPVAQANIFVDACEAAKLTDLAPALDLESPFVPGAYAAQFAIAFCRQVAIRGHRPCLYGNQSMLFGSSGVAGSVKANVPGLLLWGARYGADLTGAVDVHQYADNGRVLGVSGAVDLNSGVIPLNVRASGVQAPTTPTATAADTEEDEGMSKDSVLGQGTAAADPYVELHVPINGHRYLRIAIGYGQSFDIDGVSIVDDTPSDGLGSNVKAVQAGGQANPDRPGPWDLSGTDTAYANYSHVIIRGKAPSGVKVTAWTNDRP